MTDAIKSPASPAAKWTPSRRGLLVLAIAQAVSLLGLTALAARLDLPFLRAQAVFFFWSTAAAANLLLFSLRGPAPTTSATTRARFVRALASALPLILLSLGLLGALMSLYRCGWLGQLPLPPDRPETVRLAAILGGVAAFMLFFLGRWAHSVQRAHPDATLKGAIHLNWLGVAIHLLGPAALFFYLYSGIDGTAWAAWAVALATLVLVIETGLTCLAEIYRPPASRGQSPMGQSSLLDWTLSRSNPIRRIGQAIESTYGVKLGEIWAFRFLGQIFGPLVLFGALMVWASSCLTVVPAESEGVRMRLGRFQADPLEPGLHVGWPWPLEQIRIVPTRRIETIHIGYEEDLGGPILWDQRHYRGEKNMLAGSGEELLTVSVLIYYRIANPVTYLLRARGHGEALTHLAYRELVHVLAARESFRVMIGEREEIAEKMRSTLQAAAERLGFGVEILFIGLRDIHPPVDVAPAYQDVISAEEERHAIVYGGHKYRALNVPAAEATSNKKRLDAQSNGQARITKATGDANRFREIVSAFHDAPEFLRERLRLETLEEILPGRPKVVIDGDTPPPAPALFYLPLDPGYSVMPLLDEAPATME